MSLYTSPNLKKLAKVENYQHAPKFRPGLAPRGFKMREKIKRAKNFLLAGPTQKFFVPFFSICPISSHVGKISNAHTFSLIALGPNFIRHYKALRKSFPTTTYSTPPDLPKLESQKGSQRVIYGTHSSENSTKSHKITWEKFFHPWSDPQKPIETRKTGPFPVSKRPIRKYTK
jgi:hypothetical protein